MQTAILAIVKRILTAEPVIHAAKVAGFLVVSAVIAAAIDAVQGSSLNPTTIVIVNAVLAGAKKALDNKQEALNTPTAP